ncbi:penicillin acylase family protein [Granulicella cerasi]|uniref:Penicillin acylase family protein n=1 Tax=Granulicella cerasi TaxID=741063 RepID=A0ABW1ZCY7_9BACT
MEPFEQPQQPDATPSAESSETVEPRLPTRRGAVEEDAPERPSLREQAEAKAAAASAAARDAVSRWKARQESTPTRPSPPSQKPRRWGRIAAFSAAGVLLFCGVATGGFILSSRHDLRASIAQLDGTAHAAGLKQAVTITHDAQGVPSITAQSIDDLLEAQGYVTAQERLWQMDMLRRHAAGELAEVLGSSMLDHDRQQRILQLRATADNAVAAMSDDERHQLETYARGVNAYIDSHVNALPVEFSVLHYLPTRWTPRDSVLVMLAMWQDLSTSFPTKLDREALAQHLPADLASDLYPTSTFRDRIPSDPRKDLSTPVESIEQIPLDSTQSKLATPADLLDREQMLAPTSCSDCRAGSNNWAVSAARSASGSPIVSNDMHLGLSLPNLWFETQLHAPGIALAGFSLPGMPLIMVGRNAHVAWGFTNLGGDVQDVYIEHTRGTGAQTEYQRADGSWTAVAHHPEIIHVRARRDVHLDVQTTEHPLGAKTIAAPIISPLFPSEHRSLSLAWILYASDALHLPSLSVAQASSGVQLAQAFRNFGGPSLNLVWADDQKHIGYHAIGMIPVRGSMDRRPRSLPTLDLGQPTPEQTTEPVPDNEPDTQATMREMNFGAPHLLLSAWEPQRRRRVVRREPAKPQRVAPVRGRHRALPPQIKQPRPVAKPEPPVEKPIAPMKPVIDYVVGAAIANTPVDALDRSAAWAGVVPFDELPSIVDPANGVIATANARITPDDYPYTLSNEWVDAYRAERIYRRLERRDGLTPADMLALQTDAYSAYDHFLAQRVAYAIDHAHNVKGDTKRLQAAADLLRSFDGRMTTDSSAAAIVDAIKPALRAALLNAAISKHDHLKPNDKKVEELASLYHWTASNSAMEKLVLLQPARWLPEGITTWNDLLATVTLDALHGAPHDLARWKYADVHKQDIAHPIFGTHRRYFGFLLGTPVGLGPQAVDGDSTTVNASAKKFGASERFTADLSSADSNTANLPSGQSGNLASPHALDQSKAYHEGTTFALPLENVEVQHTLKLLPQ